MSINELYKEIGVPKTLSTHMLTVAALVKYLQEYWVGRKVPWDRVIMSALLHDVGNISKFDLKHFPNLLGDEVKNLEYWKDFQKDFIVRYGDDDHAATTQILREHTIDKRVIKIITQKSFGNILAITPSTDICIKILLYCDLRISPDGLCFLNERIKDISKRLKKYSNRTDFPQMIHAAEKLEREIESHTSISIANFSDKQKLNTYTKELLAFSL